MDSNHSPETEPHRPRGRAFLVPWLITLFVALCLLVMNTRGTAKQGSELFWDPATNSFSQSRNYQHGWPWKWMSSEPKGNPQGVPLTPGMPLTNALNFNVDDRESVWPFSVKAIDVQWSTLGCNLFVATLLLMLVFFVVRLRWIKQRRLSFSLLDMGIFVLVVSLVFANDQSHRRMVKREREYELFSHAFRVVESKWCGPEWLRSLLGEQEWMQHYRHANRMAVDLNEFEEDLSEHLSRYSHVRELEISGDPSLQQLEDLTGLPLERLKISGKSRVTSLAYISGGFGVYENAQSIIRKRRAANNFNDGEPHVSRINRANLVFPSLVELELDFMADPTNCWPRAIDLLSCCPNLRQVSLRGTQFLFEDLDDIPTTIEKIEVDFCTSPGDVADLKKRYPNATVTKNKIRAWRKDPVWVIAENRVNRRREGGWDGSQFSSWCFDLSSTRVDREFLEGLTDLFPDVYTLKFGSFDSADTAIWLAQQCSQLRKLDTSEFQFEFADAMKLPKDLRILELKQGSMTAEEVLILIGELKPKRLKLKSSSLDPVEMKTIQKMSSPHFVDFE